MFFRLNKENERYVGIPKLQERVFNKNTILTPSMHLWWLQCKIRWLAYSYSNKTKQFFVIRRNIVLSQLVINNHDQRWLIQLYCLITKVTFPFSETLTQRRKKCPRLEITFFNRVHETWTWGTLDHFQGNYVKYCYQEPQSIPPPNHEVQNCHWFLIHFFCLQLKPSHHEEETV